MPEIRKDPVFGRWVIISRERGLRPNEFRNADISADTHCPFCPGHEEDTPPTVYSTNVEGKKGWQLRVVTNKYPALVPEGDAACLADGIYDRMDGIGLHEVVIETPSHSEQLEDMELSRVTEIFRTYIKRINDIKKDPRIKYVMIFKNYGRNAGASLSHPHSQIIAMPMAPIRVVQEIDGAENYNSAKGSCVFCDIAREEAEYKKRVVSENGGFIAVTPYASRFSFETWILPKKHNSHFEDMPADNIRDLAETVKTVLIKLRRSLPELSYNLIVHTMPVHDPEVPHYHWHIEIMPKLSLVAGFEWGTGFYINTVSPEDAAAILNSGKKYKL